MACMLLVDRSPMANWHLNRPVSRHLSIHHVYDQWDSSITTTTSQWTRVAAKKHWLLEADNVLSEMAAISAYYMHICTIFNKPRDSPLAQLKHIHAFKVGASDRHTFIWKIIFGFNERLWQRNRMPGVHRVMLRSVDHAHSYTKSAWQQLRQKFTVFGYSNNL